jgi:hypothetical protein
MDIPDYILVHKIGYYNIKTFYVVDEKLVPFPKELEEAEKYGFSNALYYINYNNNEYLIANTIPNLQ